MADEERIDRVARALCVADGRDPEGLVSSHNNVEVGLGGTELHREIVLPAWTFYAGEARRMIAAVRAMGLLE